MTITCDSNDGINFPITVTERVDRKDEEEVYRRAWYLAVLAWREKYKNKEDYNFIVINFSCSKIER